MQKVDLNMIGDDGGLAETGRNVEALIQKEIRQTLLWEYRVPGKEAIFSTPITATFSGGRKVVIYQGWDWFLYVHDALTGELIWRKAFDGENYGRAQAQDVNGDGRVEIFGASHDGKIYCLDEDGAVLWSQSNLYVREGTGAVTSATAWSLRDTSKNWVANSFIRGRQGENASIEIVSGTGAGQVREISGTDPQTLWLFEAWDVVPDATSRYKVVPRYVSDVYFQHAGQLVKEGATWFLYTTGFDNQCRKTNAATGELIWRFSALENSEPYPVVTDIDQDGNIECLFLSIDRHVYCLNGVDGTVKWKRELPGGNDCFASHGDIDNDGVIEYVVNSRSGSCFILDGRTGAIKHQSTEVASWVSSEINGRPTLYDIDGDGYMEIVFGTYLGFVYCLNHRAETLWRFNQGATLRGSTNIIDINGDGAPEILAPDMVGTIAVLNRSGVEIGQVHGKGAVEGTPLIEDLDGDGKLEMVYTTTHGYVRVIRFD